MKTMKTNTQQLSEVIGLLSTVQKKLQFLLKQQPDLTVGCVPLASPSQLLRWKIIDNWNKLKTIQPFTAKSVKALLSESKGCEGYSYSSYSAILSNLECEGFLKYERKSSGPKASSYLIK